MKHQLHKYALRLAKARTAALMCEGKQREAGLLMTCAIDAAFCAFFEDLGLTPQMVGQILDEGEKQHADKTLDEKTAAPQGCQS